MADKAKIKGGIIAVTAALVLCFFLPRSTWGYIVSIVGGVWFYWWLFAGAANESSSAASLRAKPATTRKTAEASARGGTISTPEVSPRLVSVSTTSRFIPEDHAVSATPTAPSSAVAPPPQLSSTLPVSPRRFVDDDFPVSVVTKEPSESEHFAIPPAPAQYQAHKGPGRWIPPGESVVIAGSLVNGGMIYVGKDLKAYSGLSDPCLINPALPIASQADLSEREFGYWPSYSEITPRARRAYLSWLTGGRCDPAADIGYVFLFFYGLERRAIVDGLKDEQAQRERPAIALEIRRLLAIYAEKSFSFKRYASELLSWLDVSHFSKTLYNEPVLNRPGFRGDPLV